MSDSIQNTCIAQLTLPLTAAGLVQLEALEMLSNQCEGRVQSVLASMSPESLNAIKADLVSIKAEFELKDLEEEEEGEAGYLSMGNIVHLLLLLHRIHFLYKTISVCFCELCVCVSEEDKDHEFDRLMNEHIGQVGLNATAEKIINVNEILHSYNCCLWLRNFH